MARSAHPILRVLKEDTRYKIEAYEFVREALSYAQDVLGMGVSSDDPQQENSVQVDSSDEEDVAPERHLTGQQLCDASRQYALEQYGLMAKVVLNSWGINSTSDLGEIVYNLIRVDLMKKSANDRREDFDGVFDFDAAFRKDFVFSAPDA